MFATLTRVARVRTASAVDVPGTLAWQTVGAAWTVWLAGLMLGRGGAFWGGLLITGALWACVSAADRLQRFDAMGPTVAAYVRTLLLGLAMIWAPGVVSDPTADLALWSAVVVTAAAAHLLAPWAVRQSGEFELWRWWDDIKVAAAFAGGGVAGLTVLGTGLSMLGLPFTESGFVTVLAGATFCVIPTVISVRSSTRAASVRSSGAAPISRDDSRLSR